jgi:uncharacterized protein (DUF1501 family)
LESCGAGLKLIFVVAPLGANFGIEQMFPTDFRQVYATMVEKWLGVDSAAILGQKFGLLPLAG